MNLAPVNMVGLYFGFTQVPDDFNTSQEETPLHNQSNTNVQENSHMALAEAQVWSHDHTTEITQQ